MSYPKWKYHAVKEALIVGSEAEERALGEGWAESPAEFIKEEPKGDAVPALALDGPAAEQSAPAHKKKQPRKSKTTEGSKA
jgi:hypothetical protein